MGVYSVRGFAASTGTAASDLAIANLWNPDANQRLEVLEIGLFSAGTTGSAVNLARTTTEGTAGSTVTPDADNCWDTHDVPASGCRLGLSLFSAQPTKATGRLMAIQLRDTGATVAGSSSIGFVWTSPYGIWVPPGTGLCITSKDSDFVQFSTAEVYFVWEEN